MTRRKRSFPLLEDSSIDLNSLLDVIFILLIFTMVSMQVGKIQSMELDVAQVEEGAGIPREDNSVVHLRQDRKVLVDGKIYPLRLDLEGEDSWESSLAGKIAGKPVLIVSEKKVEYEDFLYALSKIKNMSPESIELGVEKRKKNGQNP